MKKIKVFLHPGMPKTATTWLQHEVFNNFPQICNIGRPNHAQEDYKALKKALIEEEDEQSAIAVIRNSLDKLSKQKEKLILSDETFYDFPLQSIIGHRLRSAGVELEVLITTRNPLSAIISHYYDAGSFLKKVPNPFPNKRVSFDNFFNFYFDSKFHSKMNCFDIARGIEGYKNYADNIHILPYEALLKDSNAFISNIEKIFGDKIKNNINMEQRNKTKTKGRRFR